MMYTPTSKCLRCHTVHVTRSVSTNSVGSKRFLCASLGPVKIMARASTTLRWHSKDDGTITATVVVCRAAIAALWSVGVSRRPRESLSRVKRSNRPGTGPRLGSRGRCDTDPEKTNLPEAPCSRRWRRLSVTRASRRPVHARTRFPAAPTHAPDIYTSCVKVSWSGVTASGYMISLYLVYAQILNLRGEG